MKHWTFLSTHGRALLCIARDPGVRIREVATELSVTERRAHAIVSDLVSAGYVTRSREGRRNRYTIQAHLPLPETAAPGRTIGELLALLSGTSDQRLP